MMKTKEYDKLIRDYIPELIEGKDVLIGTATADAEYFRYLIKKIKEELDELEKEYEAWLEKKKKYSESKAGPEQIAKLADEVSAVGRKANEELADIIEVVDSFFNFNPFNRTKVEYIKEDKKERRGSFERRYILKEVIDN